MNSVIETIKSAIKPEPKSISPETDAGDQRQYEDDIRRLLSPAIAGPAAKVKKLWDTIKRLSKEYQNLFAKAKTDGEQKAQLHQELRGARERQEQAEVDRLTKAIQGLDAVMAKDAARTKALCRLDEVGKLQKPGRQYTPGLGQGIGDRIGLIQEAKDKHTAALPELYGAAAAVLSKARAEAVVEITGRLQKAVRIADGYSRACDNIQAENFIVPGGYHSELWAKLRRIDLPSELSRIPK